MEEEKISYLPAFPAKSWETTRSSWKKSPAYGAYTIGEFNPNWSTELHDKGLTLPPFSLGEMFRHGLYPFYVHMILLNEFPIPFRFHVRPGADDTTYYPHSNPATRQRYEQFVEDLMIFLDPYYENVLEPLGIIYQRWKIVEEFLDKNNSAEAPPEVIFLKDSVQTLFRTILHSLIEEYFNCVREKNIKEPETPETLKRCRENFVLEETEALDLKNPKKRAIFDFLKTNNRFLQRPFPQNNVDNSHYEAFSEKLQPLLKLIMRIPF